jgi:hypothetical protein
MQSFALSGFNGPMDWTDFVTGETLFQFPAPATASSVILGAFINVRPMRVQMQRCANDWIARLKLPAGWCFYRFEVDGRAVWDCAVGKMKTNDGRPRSLALIAGNLKHLRENAASPTPLSS